MWGALLACREVEAPAAPPPAAEDSGTLRPVFVEVRAFGFVDSGASLCVFAEISGGGNGWPPDPLPVSVYGVPIDVAIPPPEPRDPLPGVAGVVAVVPWTRDRCALATHRTDGAGGVVLVVGPDGELDPTSPALAFDGAELRGLTRHGDAVWVTGEDVDGPFAVELGPDGEALGRLPLPVAAEVVRPLPDGFLLATTDPPAAWRVDRRGSLRADWGDGGVVEAERGVVTWAEVDVNGLGDALFLTYPRQKETAFPYLVHVTAGGSRRRWFPRHEPGQALWDGDDGYLISGLAGVSRRHAGGRPDGSFETRYGVGELGSGATGAVGLLSGSWAYSDRDWIATRLTSR
jgi:hypothetical protein